MRVKLAQNNKCKAYRCCFYVVLNIVTELGGVQFCLKSDAITWFKNGQSKSPLRKFDLKSQDFRLNLHDTKFTCHFITSILKLYNLIAWINNNYSMSPSWIWSDKITNSRYALVGYNHFISNKNEWNNCFSKFSNRVLPAIFISTILQSVRKENLAHCFPYEVKLQLLAHSRSFLANQKARNAIVGAENLLNINIFFENVTNEKTSETMLNFRMWDHL